MPAAVRAALAALESDIESRNYKITAIGKADGSTEVTLTHKVSGNKWTGIGPRTSSFPYESALKQANARMMAYETRFDS